jgi:hypothetical protein
MRWTLLILGFVMFAGCNWFQGATGGTGGDTGEAGTPCSQSDGCQACTACAIGGNCASLYMTCEADPECMAIDDCFGNCTPGDTTCQSNCYTIDPNGASEYMAVTNCVDCEQCNTACGLCTN